VITEDMRNIFIHEKAERSFLSGLMSASGFPVFGEMMLKIKKDIFSSNERRKLFEIITSLHERSLIANFDTVGMELFKNRDNASLNEFNAILSTESEVNLSYALMNLKSLSIDLKGFDLMYKALLEMTNENQSFIKVGEKVSVETDKLLIIDDTGTHTYAEVRERVAKMPIQPLYKTGIAPLDKAFNGGMRLGQLIITLGDPDAGKTLISKQIALNFAKEGAKSSQNFKAGIFPFEFKEEQFARDLMVNNRDDSFHHDNLLINDRAVNIGDLKISIIEMVQRGAKYIVVDSQMMLEDDSYEGASEGYETQKFLMLMRLAIKYNIIINIISQKGKADSTNKVPIPYGTKKGAHMAHIIIEMLLPNPDNKKEPILKIQKNKQNGFGGSFPLELNVYSLLYKPKGEKSAMVVEYDGGL